MAEKKRPGMSDAFKAHQFKKGVSGNTQGRPRNRVIDSVKAILPRTKAGSAEGLSIGEVNAIEKMVLALSPKDLQRVAESENAPTYLKNLTQAVLMDMSSGYTRVVDKLRDRQYGPVKQNMDITTDGESINGGAVTITQEEAAQLLKRLEKDY